MISSCDIMNQIVCQMKRVTTSYNVHYVKSVFIFRRAHYRHHSRRFWRVSAWNPCGCWCGRFSALGDTSRPSSRMCSRRVQPRSTIDRNGSRSGHRRIITGRESAADNSGTVWRLASARERPAPRVAYQVRGSNREPVPAPARLSTRTGHFPETSARTPTLPPHSHPIARPVPACAVNVRVFCPRTVGEPPRGRTGSAEGCRSLRRGGGNGGSGEVCITLALCKSGSEGSPEGVTLAGTDPFVSLSSALDARGRTEGPRTIRQPYRPCRTGAASPLPE